LSHNKNPKGIWDSIKSLIYDDLIPHPPPPGTDLVSSNSKVVLFALFALVGFAVLTYAITVTGNNYTATEDVSTPGPNNTTVTSKRPLNDTIQLERLQQLEQVNAVYIAAISGSLALGGTLIAQLWGRG
jgi:hypothetical protein